MHSVGTQKIGADVYPSRCLSSGVAPLSKAMAITQRTRVYLL